MIADLPLAALCLAGALAGVLGALLIGRRSRRVALVIRPWLLATWILLTIGLSAVASGGLAKFDLIGWTLGAAWLVVGALVHVVDRSRRRAARRWGGRLAHFGVAVAIGGVILSSAFTMSSERAMSPGDTLKFAAWTIKLHDVWPAAGAGWAGVSAQLRATSGDGVVVLEPQQRTIFDRSQRAEPAAVTNWSGMLTAVLSQQRGDGNWPILLTWTPLLALIPLGGLIAAIGGALAMVGPAIARWRRLRRARLATAWWA